MVGEAFADEFIFEMGRAWSRELGMALKKGSDTEKVHNITCLVEGT